MEENFRPEDELSPEEAFSPGEENWEDSLEEAVLQDDMEAFGHMAGDLMNHEPLATMEELLSNAEGFTDEFFTAWANSIRQNKDLLKNDPKVLEQITDLLCRFVQEEHRWKILHKIVILIDGFAGLATQVCLEYLHASRDACQSMQQASESLLKAMHPKGKEENWSQGFVDLWQEAVDNNEKRKAWERHVETSHFLNHFERVLSLLYRQRDRLWTPSMEILDKLIRAFSFHANYLQMARGNITNLQGLTAAMLEALNSHIKKLGIEVTNELAKRQAWDLLDAICLQTGEAFIENQLDPQLLRAYRAYKA